MYVGTVYTEYMRTSPDGVLGIARISPVDYIRRILLTPLLVCINPERHIEKRKRDARLGMAFGLDFLFPNALLSFNLSFYASSSFPPL